MPIFISITFSDCNRFSYDLQQLSLFGESSAFIPVSTIERYHNECYHTITASTLATQKTYVLINLYFASCCDCAYFFILSSAHLYSSWCTYKKKCGTSHNNTLCLCLCLHKVVSMYVFDQSIDTKRFSLLFTTLT